MVNLADLSDENVSELYRSIGIVAIWWSFVEYDIDLIVALIYHHFDGKKFALREEIPVSLKPKIKFIRKSLQNLAIFSQITENGLKLMDSVTQYSKQRHDLLHSRVTGIDKDSFKFEKIDYMLHMHSFRIVKYDVEDIRQFGENLMGLATELIHYFADLAEQHFKIV